MKTLQQFWPFLAWAIPLKKAALPVTLAFWGLLNSAAYSQITPATRGTGTTIIQNGQQIDIGESIREWPKPLSPLP